MQFAALETDLASLLPRLRGVQQGSQEDILRLVTPNPRSPLSLSCPQPPCPLLPLRLAGLWLC